MPPVRSGSPHGGAGDGEGEGASATTAWTGGKKRKVLVSPLPSLLGYSGQAPSTDDAHQGESSTFSSDGATAMDIQFQDQGKGEGGSGGGLQGEEDTSLCEEEELVYSEQDLISLEENDACAAKLKAYEGSHFVYTDRELEEDAAIEELYNRLTLIRLKAYMSSKGDPILDDSDTAAALKKCPPKILLWTNEPAWTYDFMLPGALDWNFDPKYWVLSDLSDYQRMIVTKFSCSDYCDWDEYRVTFSDYKTDEDYVKYCDALSKKIKWIEQYLRVPCVPRVKSMKSEYVQRSYIAGRQVMKIAAGFPHMTMTLARRGYSEYIWSRSDYIPHIQDYIQIYFEVWKRVTKQEMSFLDALKEVHSKNMFPALRSVMQHEIEEGHVMKKRFDICMAHIGSEVLTDDETEKKIADTVRNVIYKRANSYLDYVRMKLEIGRRIGLIPKAG